MSEALKAGMYRHVKGGLYLVLGIAQDHETHEHKVVYVSFDTGKPGPRMIIRPSAEWNDRVSLGDDGNTRLDPDGKLRFEFVPEGMPLSSGCATFRAQGPVTIGVFMSSMAAATQPTMYFDVVSIYFHSSVR